jgi:hypothetical protein
MDPGLRSPLIDFFRRGEVARDVRLLAARGALAPRALEQLALLLLLHDDGDVEVATAARATLEALPEGAVSRFLGRSDVPVEMRDWFVARGVTPGPAVAGDDDPLVEVDDPSVPVADEGDTRSRVSRLASMGVMEKMKVAMRGSREERSVLIRDPNRIVAAAVLSSPKLTEQEVESIAKMANVTEEVLRVIGTTRAWTKNYTITAGLVRNPKTPIAISLTLLGRLTDRDAKLLTTDRNVPEPVRIAARKRTSEPGRR